jgi:K+-sensing histidine kinase KdpD
MARGKLRMYLGAAPGVGKTYAMLSEAPALLTLLLTHIDADLGLANNVLLFLSTPDITAARIHVLPALYRAAAEGLPTRPVVVRLHSR